MREKGERYRPVVQILKMRKGKPTVIRVSGNEYQLRHPHQYERGKETWTSHGQNLRST